jgi:hypothetical protein
VGEVINHHVTQKAVTMASQRFESAVNKLVNAYIKGTLEPGSCAKCAVGNICGEEYTSMWYSALLCVREDILIGDFERNIIDGVKNSTGYSIHEIDEIEKAFEKNTGVEDTEENQYKGLCAVFDKLCELEGIPDSKPYKEMLEMT